MLELIESIFKEGDSIILNLNSNEKIEGIILKFPLRIPMIRKFNLLESWNNVTMN